MDLTVWLPLMNTMAAPGPLLALILLAGPAKAATVLSVGDGDTVRISEGAQRITIRLACIDALETAQAPYGATTRTQLQQYLPVGSVVSLKVQTKDRYRRTVAEMIAIADPPLWRREGG